MQVAQYGLAVLEEKQTLKQQYDELETLYETTKTDFECAKEVGIVHSLLEQNQIKHDP